MRPVTQEDPIGIAGGLNLYGYANGDPINYSDPFGLCPWCIGAVVGAAFEAGAQLLLEDAHTLDGKRIFLAGVAGAASGGVSTVAKIGAVGRALATAAISVGEGKLKAAVTGRSTSGLEDLANALSGGLASGVGDELGAVADDAAHFLLRNSRVQSGGAFSFEARQEMAKALDERLKEASMKAALAGGVGGQGGRVVPGGGS